jgi:hypothetical protein
MTQRRRRTTIWYLAIAVLGVSLSVYDKVPSSRRFVASNPSHSPHYKDLGYVPNLYVAYIARDGRIFGIEDHFLYTSVDGGRSFRQAGSLPKINASWLGKIKDHLARSKLVRMLRGNEGPNNLVVLSSGTILVFFDHIYRSTDGGMTFHPVFKFEDIGSPFAYSEGVAVGADDTVYFGEYSTTPRPHRVRIIEGTDDGKTWKIAHTFPPGEIFHVHSIQYDPFRSCYWITTGDHDSESKILYSHDGFKTLRELGAGTQDWRVVSLMITKENLFWGSDNDIGPAGIFRWNFADQKLTKLTEIGKPSYYSTIMKNGTLVLSTTYEPESSFVQNHRPEATTDIWVSRDGNVWAKIYSLRYEMRSTEWGPSRAAIAFPGGIFNSDELMFTPVSTAEHNFTTRFIVPQVPDAH